MKPITINQQVQNKILADFKKYLETNRFADNKLNYTCTLQETTKGKAKPRIIFTVEAYMKMKALINRTDTEIGWHGTVTREGNNFTITDILVYPQIVSGSNVETDQKEYQDWLMKQPDEIFNKIRYQGHSHVNFGVVPSGPDEILYDRILQSLKKNDYYIFMIANKRDQFTILLYDLKENTLYDKEDVTVDVLLPSDMTLDAWYKTVSELTRETKTTHTAYVVKAHEVAGTKREIKEAEAQYAAYQKEFQQRWGRKPDEEYTGYSRVHY